MRIRKFNESNEDGFDIDYINQCFAEISDEFDLKIEEDTRSGENFLRITIDLPIFNAKIRFNNKEISDITSPVSVESSTQEPLVDSIRSISDLIKSSENLTKILKLVDISIIRLSDEHPEYQLSMIKYDFTQKLFITIRK